MRRARLAGSAAARRGSHSARRLSGRRAYCAVRSACCPGGQENMNSCGRAMERARLTSCMHGRSPEGPRGHGQRRRPHTTTSPSSQNTRLAVKTVCMHARVAQSGCASTMAERVSGTCMLPERRPCRQPAHAGGKKEDPEEHRLVHGLPQRLQRGRKGEAHKKTLPWPWGRAAPPRGVKGGRTQENPAMAMGQSRGASEERERGKNRRKP